MTLLFWIRVNSRITKAIAWKLFAYACANAPKVHKNQHSGIKKCIDSFGSAQDRLFGIHFHFHFAPLNVSVSLSLTMTEVKGVFL